jgi:UDP-N-acetylmuramate-alanine ligase
VAMFSPIATLAPAIEGRVRPVFYGADLCSLPDIYAASEDPIEGITSRALANRSSAGHRHVEYIGGW